MSRAIAGHCAALFTVFVWGLTFVSTKELLAAMSPLEILFTRFLIGWLALWLMRPRWPKTSGLAEEAIFAASGLTGVTLYFLLENTALALTNASNVGVIVTAAPFFTALLAWAFTTRKRPAPSFFAGFVLALGGIAMISFNGARISLNPAGDFLALAAAFVWAIYTLLTRDLSKFGYGSVATTRRVFFYGLLFMLPCVAIKHFTVPLYILLQPKIMANLLFLGLGASAICFATWTFTVQRLGATAASAYIYLVPVITVISAAIILGETLTPLALTGAGMAIGGLILAEKPAIRRKTKL